MNAVPLLILSLLASSITLATPVVTVPDADFSGTAQFPNSAGVGTTLNFHNSSGGSNLLNNTLQAVAGPVPGLFGLVAGGDLQGASLDATMTYSFVIDGPSTGIPVELLVDASVGWTVAGNVINGQASSQWGAFSSVSVNNAGGLVSACNESTTCTDNGSSATLHAFTNTGDVNSIVVHIVASASNFFVAGNVTTVTVFADPIISFPAGFDSTGYSIVLSSGIGNGVSAVPEPGTRWMLAIPLIGLAMLRRRQSAQRGL
jgi:hypothetical protein